MSRAGISRVAAVLPLLFATLAFALAMANILAGVSPQQDENASAHMWQLLMSSQLPLIGLFVLTANWKRPATLLILATQILGIAIACAPVWLAGY